ncbi:hypothetical protein AWJ20_2184 [Sugiyamaella lignohabitans]|uniref:Phytanoyl-CoA dioxygenase n=1 Tax=Sugiyamaella lignohabitans TaxID=796027 RepID=A0A167EXS5_9ASCO|nr:uncharacterized protein AWJ20_2184 [Sugiyamaella lignohabitans]ANB14584.1 hypothetical protein AWJ20_2184 [Sugiyamaella lignohabitans]
MTSPKYNCLTQEQVDHFLEKGYVVIHDAFSKEHAAWMLKDVWVRLGLDPNNRESWTKPRIHMPKQRSILVSEFAPKAWDAIKDLLGGDENIADAGKYWNDSLIVNFGRDQFEPHLVSGDPKQLDNWHTDGNFFRHFLDSPEQALLVIPIFSDEIKPKGGATYIAPDSIPHIAKLLDDHPEGLLPGKPFNYPELVNKCNEFVEVTGKVGDVVLMHPFMMHSASPNQLRIPRFITNPPVSLKTPFRFDRPLDQLNLVEQKTLKSLGKSSPYHFKPTADRVIFPSEQHDMWIRMQNEEKQRLKDYGTLESFTAIGVKP